jgi:hypothetical protein
MSMTMSLTGMSRWQMADAPMVKSGRSDYDSGCSCCNSAESRRKAIHSMKRREKRAWKKESETER